MEDGFKCQGAESNRETQQHQRVPHTTEGTEEAGCEFQEGFLEARPGLLWKVVRRVASRHRRAADGSQPGSPELLPPPAPRKSSAEGTRWQERQVQPQSLVVLTSWSLSLPLGEG